MKVVGFSFIKNAVKYDFPIVEAILSVLPLCDVFVLALGDSEDETEALIAQIDSPKIQLVRTQWDNSLREGGRVLAEETNKAYQAIPPDADWCLYIQGDEVLHEQYHAPLREAMQRWKDAPEVDGLLLNYRHFWGSYQYVGSSSRWYRREVRVVRKRDDIFSYRDAQGFRKGDNEKLKVKLTDAYMYHYGWVKPPETMLQKIKRASAFWHSDEWIAEKLGKKQVFDYAEEIDSLEKFTGTHPTVMLPRVAKQGWTFEYDVKNTRYSLKQRFKEAIRKWTGYYIGEYKNYTLLP